MGTAAFDQKSTKYSESRSFKSSGELRTSRKYTVGSRVGLAPVGVKTPISLVEGGNDTSTLLEMHFDIRDQMHDNLRNLLNTNFGERLGRADFGANLRDMSTEFTAKDDFEAEAMIRIDQAVSRYMPMVELMEFSTDFDADVGNAVAKFNIRLKYNISKLLVKDRELELTIYCSG